MYFIIIFTCFFCFHMSLLHVISTIGASCDGLVGCVAQLVERRSLTGELSLSCARPAADR